jgi:phosphoesterase, MJ0936 family
MRVGLVSDIHGNLPALETVLADMPPVDRLLCAGDVVGYNPWPADCVERLRARSVPTVAGNHDRAVFADRLRMNRMANARIEYAREQLTGDQRAWVRELPVERTACDGRVKVVHGHPDAPDRYTYPDEFSGAMLGPETVLVLGHTHVQAHRTFDEGVVVNPGSVGQPRDGDPWAAYAVVDLSGEKAPAVEEHRVAYDVDRVAERVEAVGLPPRIGARLRTGQ